MPVSAVNSLHVEGLFKNKAVLMIDGKRRVVQVGNESPEGVKLISIIKENVELAVNGKRKIYKLGETQAFTTSFAKPEHVEVKISSDGNGMYHTAGSINGMSVDFLVDTGATVITMNAHEAKRLGIDVKRAGQPIIVNTASSIVRAHQVMLNKVTVGGIEMQNISAVVMSGPQPEKTLLGMSFLGQLEIQRNSNMMTLRKKW